MIWNSLHFTEYFWESIILYVFSMVITALIVEWSVRHIRAYKAIINVLNGYLHDFINNIKFIKINSLQNVLMSQISKLRILGEKRHLKLLYSETLLDMMYFTPTLATSLILMWVPSAISGSFDVVIMYAVISALTQLRKPLLALTEFLEKRAEFKRSYQNFCTFLYDVPDHPIASLKLPYKSSTNTGDTPSLTSVLLPN